MLNRNKRLLNLIVVLGLLLVMLPQRGSTAQSVADNTLPPGLPDNSDGILQLPSGEKEKELHYNLQANQKVLSIAAWHFRTYGYEVCHNIFMDYNYGKKGPWKEPVPEIYCWLTYPLLLPAGVTIDMVFFNFYDNDPDIDMLFYLVTYDDLGTGAETLVTLNSEGTPGYDFVGANVYQVIQSYRTYTLLVTFPRESHKDLMFSSVNIIYEEPASGLFGQGFPIIQK